MATRRCVQVKLTKCGFTVEREGQPDEPFDLVVAGSDWEPLDSRAPVVIKRRHSVKELIAGPSQEEVEEAKSMAKKEGFGWVVVSQVWEIPAGVTHLMRHHWERTAIAAEEDRK